MRLHTNKVTLADVHQAARDVAPGVSAMATEYGSRSHAGAIELRVLGNGPRGSGFSNPEFGPTGTWDEWGVVLGRLFDIDPGMRAGGTAARPIYDGRVGFADKTMGRFTGGELPADSHKRHQWDHDYRSNYSACKVCSAEMLTY